ncbi:MAG: hypothetical protein GQ533_00905 [Methanosarcinaceae archaeon]|nr:hypothetical protein [Methanosarcinaceae archaeon]
MGNISIVILEELGNQNYILKCACCNGSGEMSRDHDRRSPYTICSVCNGRGKVLIKLNGSLPFVKCAVCNGIGEMSRDHDGRSPYRICSACLGLGAQPITGSMKLMR